jgi:mRNA interferase RelE/StbE
VAADAYTVVLRPKARRALARLDRQAREAVAQVIDALADDPRPAGVLALQGHRPYLRVRSGDYRVIFAVDDDTRLVRVAVVGHRRDVYRNLSL